MYVINHYDAFVDALLEVGFSLAGANNEGVYSLANHFTDEIAWHTDKPDTDPWEWRMRVLAERDDIAYSKVFFKKNGYITRQWYPHFLAVRRAGKSLEAMYQAGAIGSLERSIYQIIAREGPLPTHLLKQLLNVDKSQKSAFDRALTNLQMGLFITLSGRRQKTSKQGESYGWSSTVVCTTEVFWGDAPFKAASQLTQEAAFQTLYARVLQLNPSANERRIKKFITG